MKRFAYLALPLLSILLAALWAIWPVPLVFFDALPTGDSPTATVPLLNVWIYWWNSEWLFLDNHSYWNAPAFAPAEGVLAFSEPQPAAIVLGPVTLGLDNLVAAYNLYVVLHLCLNGLFGWRLLKQLEAEPAFQLAGSLALVLHPIALHNLEACQLLAIWPMLWMMSLLVRLRESETPFRDGGLLGIAISLQVAMCMHHALFVGLLAPLLVPLLPSLKNWQQIIRVAIGAAAPVGLTALFIVLPMAKIHGRYDLARSHESITALSAKPIDWLVVPNPILHPQLVETGTSEFPLSPGILRSFLAVVACAAIVRKPCRARLSLCLILAGSVLLSFGNNLTLGESSLWGWLGETLPPITRIRSPYRFAYLGQTAAIVLAALAANDLAAWLRRLASANTRRGPSRLNRFATASTVLVLFLVVAAEVTPRRTFVFNPPRRHAEPNWVSWLKKNTPLGTSILCLPAASNSSEQSEQVDALWMYYATMHRRPILNGYSGFSPPAWSDLRTQLTVSPLPLSAIATARDLGAQYVVLDLRSPLLNAQVLEQFESVYRDNKFEIRRIDETPSPADTRSMN